MRPNALFEGSSRPRKHSTSIDRNSTPSGPTTFFLTSESDLDRRASNVSTSPDSTRLRTTKDSATASSSRASPNRTKYPQRDGSRRRSTIRPKSIEELRQEASRHQSLLPQPASGVLTPAQPSSQEPSLPSSPKSMSTRSIAKSDEDLTPDESSSQAVESEEEDESESLDHPIENSAPQLIMPSIRMPSRRPFTERGKQMGKFKIMVAGSRGSGKTSLIKSIVQLCEDIVHVDPFTSSSISRSTLHGRNTANAFHETYASTRPYPSWWSDMDESRVLRRRKSMGDFVLERNLCFVDSSHTRSPAFATSYIEQQLIKTITYANQATTELTTLMSGSGGSQVDLVMYLVSHTTIKDDVQQINQLMQITNVIPLISKSDLLTPAQIDDIKAAVQGDNCSVPRLPITFGTHLVEAMATAPYSISCVNGPDYDNMDASLLMASEYIQPLVPSELSLLVDQILQPENVAYLRHLSAKKLVSWYSSGQRFEGSIRTSSPASTRVRSPIPSTLNSPLQASLSASGVLVPIISHSDLSFNTANSFALAKVADHAQKEERLAQIRLSKWASDLQLSLQREREKYEKIARSERALWLVERMGEEIREGQLVPVGGLDIEEGEAENAKLTSKSKRRLYKDGGIAYQVHDPLGLLRWQDMVRAQTWLALQIVGSFGVVGGLALFVTKTWGYETSFHQWAREIGLWQD
ncbi:hypothetical protein LTS08_008372 [Lithohypha guttulata]|nr:hypothetical protein LTS08_008372 [Lithohypha guttulata]